MQPTPEQIVRVKRLLPTTLGTDALRERYAAELLRRSFFSAKTAMAAYLKTLQQTCAQFAAGRIDLATARASLMAQLAQYGLSPQDGGGLGNLAGARRLNLILRTQKQMAASVADINAQSEDVVNAYPAWELVRYGSRRVPRQDWGARWTAAGDDCGWVGALHNRMMALKDSPIWDSLGAGAGGYKDALGNPYPPFAFSSGLAWRDVPRADAVEAGLIGEHDKVAKHDASLDPSDAELRAYARKYGIAKEAL